jgi:multicopper oxidase
MAATSPDVLVFEVASNGKLKELQLVYTDSSAKCKPVFVAKFRYNLITDSEQRYGAKYYLFRTRTLDIEREIHCPLSPLIHSSIPGPIMVGTQNQPMRFRLVNRNPDIDCVQGNELDCDPTVPTPKCDAEIITKSIKGIPQDVNIFHGFNNINMHTHGLHVSPGGIRSFDDSSGISDNVLLKILPTPGPNTPKLNALIATGILEEQTPKQGIFYIGHGDYCIAIPSDHPVGNFIYHPHSHGGVTSYLNGGLISGILIESSCKKNGYPDLKTESLVFQVFFMRNTKVMKRVNVNGQFDELPMYRNVNWNRCVTNPNPGQTIQSADIAIYTTNGQVNPIIYVPANESRLFMLTQGMESENMLFGIESETGEAVPFYLIALDGVQFSEPQLRMEVLLGVANTAQIIFSPTTLGYQRPVWTEYRLLKKEFPSDGPDASFRNTLGIISNDSYPLVRTVMATIKVTSVKEKSLCRYWNPLSTRVKSDSLQTPRFFKRALNLPWSGVKCPLTHCPDPPIYREHGKLIPVSRLLSFDLPPSINKRPFSNVVTETVLLGTKEIWRFYAPLPSNGRKITHTAHIHIRWYLVVAMKDPNQNDGNAFLVEPPVWMNTFALPAGGWIDAIQPFLDFTGKYFLHCHTVIHEDLGMMTTIESVKPGGPKIVNSVNEGKWKPPSHYIGIHGCYKPEGLDACKC